MDEDSNTISSGYLRVGHGHSIYYQEWGNKDNPPIFFLHGGPGSGCSNKHKLSFDPKLHHVIFHDQRGCGRSKPLGKLTNNTTDDLIRDINNLKNHLGLTNTSISFAGGSWGSCLALAYALHFPSDVKKMLLWGIYTGTKEETDYVQQGGLATHFPDSWKQYIEVVPKNKQNNTVSYYFEKMTDPDTNIANDYVKRWIINEAAAMSIDPDLASTTLSLEKIDDSTRANAILEAHYFMNSCFLSDMQILKNAYLLQDIPIVLVQGRHDHVCPPQTAYALQEALGSNCHLHITPGSHAREQAMREVVRSYAWAWLAF